MPGSPAWVGKASKNTLNMGGNPIDVSTVVTWEGPSPVLTSSMKFGENDAQSVEKWSLDPDGTIARDLVDCLVAGLGHASMGNMDWGVLGFLLVGSLPGITIGAYAARADARGASVRLCGLR